MSRLIEIGTFDMIENVEVYINDVIWEQTYFEDWLYGDEYWHYEEREVTEGFNIEFKAINGLAFESDLELDFWWNEKVINLTGNGVSKTGVVDYSDLRDNATTSLRPISVNMVVAPEPEPEPEPEPLPERLIEIGTFDMIENVEVYINDVIWDKEYFIDNLFGDEYWHFPERVVNDGFNIEFKAINDLIFETDLELDFWWIDKTIHLTGNGVSKTGIVEFSDLRDNATTSLRPSSFNMILSPRPEVENFPFTKIYEVDSNGLNELSKFNLVKVESINNESGQVTTSTLNYGKYITGLFIYPFSFNYDDEKTNILLGDIDTAIPSIPISSNTKTIDFGYIEVPISLSHGVGYKNITIDLYVPYFDKINLDVDEVLGGRIDLTLNINLLTGKGTLNILNHETNSVIDTVQTQIGVKIPYEVSESLSISLSSDVLQTDYEKPYLEVKVLKPDNTVTLEVISKVNLDTTFNYIKDSDDLMFSTIATEREQKLIKDMVARGVFVRK